MAKCGWGNRACLTYIDVLGQIFWDCRRSPCNRLVFTCPPSTRLVVICTLGRSGGAEILPQTMTK